MRPFSNKELAELRAILLSAFNPASLRMMLQDRLDKNLEHLVGAGGLQVQIFELLNLANQENWNFQLIDAALAERPDHPKLLQFSAKVGLTARSTGSLEVLVQSSPFQDISALIRRLYELEHQICRIELPNGGKGTGFLVGPDLVLTNYHVVEKLIIRDMPAAQVICRFDYRRADDDSTVFEGTTYGLASGDPIVAYSPYDSLDLQDPPTPLSSGWPADKLDYALVRLSEAAGEAFPGPWGSASGFREQARGWIRYNSPSPTLSPNDDLFILQHPNGAPIKVALGTEAVIGADLNQKRVRYKTNTEAGSSGSPCFNSQWQWVALHHAGDPSWTPRFNQGIPVGAILEHLRSKGLDNLLTQA